MGATEVEKFMAHGRSLARQESHLVIPIQVVLVGPVAELHTLEELIGDVGIAGSVQQGREPVESGDNAVLN